MQLATIYRRITKKYDFEIICIQGRSADSKDFYSYGEGSNKLSKDFNLGQPYGQNSFLTLDPILSIDKYEEHFKNKGYSYTVLEYFIEHKPYHKVTRTSDNDSLGLTSLQLEKEIKNKKLLKKEDSLSAENNQENLEIHKTSLYSFKGKSFDDQESYRKALAQSSEAMNAYKPWTSEEDEILLSSDNKAVKDLASILHRRTGAIRSRLKKLDVKNDTSKFMTDNLFFSAILKGIDPITAEILPKGHAWHHPKIISDIKEHIKNIKTNKPQTQTKKNGILVTIKNNIKKNYDINFVLIQNGAFFEAVDEDAQWLIDELGMKGMGNRNPPQCGFPLSAIDKYQQNLIEHKMKFCILEQKKDTNYEKGFIRQVTESSDAQAIGIQFINNKLLKLDYKESSLNESNSLSKFSQQKNHSSGDLAISESKDKLTQPGVDAVCSECGKLFNQDRRNLGYKTCLTCGENEAHKKAPKLDEGLPGTREENKKMRAQVWGEIRNRNKGN